jgi:hypothetical protein
MQMSSAAQDDLWAAVQAGELQAYRQALSTIRLTPVQVGTSPAFSDAPAWCMNARVQVTICLFWLVGCSLTQHAGSVGMDGQVRTPCQRRGGRTRLGIVPHCLQSGTPTLQTMCDAAAVALLQLLPLLRSKHEEAGPEAATLHWLNEVGLRVCGRWWCRQQ